MLRAGLAASMPIRVPILASADTETLVATVAPAIQQVFAG